MNSSEQELIILKTVDFVKETLSTAEGGHDWWHILRVWKLSKDISQTEKVDNFVVELGALLHDIADSKFNSEDEEIGPRKAKEFLTELKVDTDVINHVENIIRNISYKGGDRVRDFSSVELDVVQDADRLDALGAIGIARAFNYGGFINAEIYNPTIKSCLTKVKEQCKKEKEPTLNHFYKKLLLLKDKMNTKTGRKISLHRHKYIEEYLDEFYKEWDGAL